ncbi:MAG: sensor histidine kinase [Weeksellaceae bacterium]
MNNNILYKNRYLTGFTHILIWLTLFGLPYLLTYGQSNDINRLFIHFWVPIAFYAVLFYTNYFYLIDKFLFTGRLPWFICINLALVIFFIFLREYIDQSIFNNVVSNGKERKGPPFQLFIFVQILFYLAPLFFAIALKSTQRWIRTETKRKEAENYKLQSELQHLHYQLQPHFFFNSLNNIYSMVDLSPEQAKKSIHSLSKLMRYLLYETNVQEVPLAKEVEFMIKYIELMKLRISNKTKVNYTFPAQDNGIKIAPLLFISLIENAFKHGVSASLESDIHIQMTIDNKTVFLRIENNNFPKKADDKSGSGIGLKNLEKRLQLLYPNKHDFKTQLIDDKFVVDLEIKTD